MTSYTAANHDIIKEAFPGGLAQCELDPDDTCRHCGEKFNTHFGAEDLLSGYQYHDLCVLGAAEDSAERQDQKKYEGL